MENIKELYIQGDFIKTDIGDLHFIKVKQYPHFIRYISFLTCTKHEIINAKLIKDLKETEELKSISELEWKALIEYFKEADLFSIIHYLKNAYYFYHIYKEVFQFCFKEDVFDKIRSNEEFEYYRDLIRKINQISYDPPNPNDEIERFNRLERLYNQKNSEGLTYESVYTSVWLSLGTCPDELTLYRLYALFHRIGQFKNHDATTLFRTVGDTKIESWYKHIDLLENKQDKGMSLEEFEQKAKSTINQ